MQKLIWMVPLAPLAGSLANALFGRFTRERAHWIALPAVGLSFIFACFVFNRVSYGETFHAPLYQWIVAGSFKAAVTAHVDQLTALMLLVVTGVGFLIHLYSVGYMHGDPGYARYFTYLNLFVFSMVMLVVAGDFLLLYVFWEAVGLCSYLLIGFWYQKKSAADAGKKAFIVNRVGDFGFGLGVMLLWTVLGTLDYQEVFSRAGTIPWTTATAIALLLFMGACGKSAQLPLHTWLPDAMEGPTPVSALIHAATMVTAGVYMVARSHAIFEQSGVALEVVLWVGALTAVFAATIGLVQTDIKRVLAYSTVSQLGYMFVGLGVSAYAAGIYHLMTHAFFKALLFMGAGSVIHSLRGEQDLRFMGGLAPRMLSTTLTFGVGALAISGVPPFSGFFSKDEILSAVYHSGHRGLWILLLAGALMTACYTWRLFFLAFSGAPRMSKEAAHHVHESPASMTIPLWVLAFLALAASVVGIPLAKGTAIDRFLAPVFPRHGEAAHSGALFLLSFLIAVAGITIAWSVFVRRPIRPTAIGQPKGVVRRWLVNKYYVDELYDVLFVRSFHSLANFCARRFDLGLIDGIVNGVGRVVVNAANRWRLVQTGYAMNYALGMLVGAVAIIAVLFLR